MTSSYGIMISSKFILWVKPNRLKVFLLHKLRAVFWNTAKNLMSFVFALRLQLKHYF